MAESNDDLQTPAPLQPTDDRRRRPAGMGVWLTPLVVVCAVGWIYGRGIHAPFIFDDKLSVTDNRSIVALWPLWGDDATPGPLHPPRDISTSGRPLVNLSLALNYHFGGLDPTGYHVVNILLHAANALLLWGILRRTLRLPCFADRFGLDGDLLSGAVALLWAMHPLNSEAVAYVTQRTELLVGCFYLGTLYAAIRAWSSGDRAARWRWTSASVAACTLGMACKEVMVSAPVVVLLYERTFVRASFREALRASRVLYVGLAASWLVLIALNYDQPRALSAGFDAGVAVAVWWFTQAKVLFLYLKLACWPDPLALHYEFPYVATASEAMPWIAMSTVLCAAAAILTWRRSSLGFVGACLLLILAPTLIVPIVTEVAAERRMYLPLAALVSGVLLGGYSLLRKGPAAGQEQGSPPSRVAAMVTAATALGLVLLAGWTTARRVELYNDPVALWQQTVTVQPYNARAQNNLGVVLVEAGQPGDALAHYAEALRLRPNYPEAASNWGVALIELGDHAAARERFEATLELDPQYADAHINLGHLAMQSGDATAAVAHYRAALSRKPSLARVHGNLGHALNAVGDRDAALDEFRAAVRLDPQLAEAHLSLGVAQAAAGNNDAAIAHYEDALRANPNFVEAHNNWGALLHGLGRTDEAIGHFRAALAIHPDFADAHGNLGIALMAQGKMDDGLAEFQQAARLKPAATTLANLAIIYAQLGQQTEALATIDRAIALAQDQGQQALAAQLQAWRASYRRSLTAP